MHTYIYLAAWKSDEMHAWALLKVAGPTARWIDLVWDGRDPTVLFDLEKKAAQVARRAGAARMKMWMRNDEKTIALFRQRGWQPVAQASVPFLVARSFSPQLDAPDFVRRFYFTMGDSDLV
jgi:hypothetical protein